MIYATFGRLDHILNSTDLPIKLNLRYIYKETIMLEEKNAHNMIFEE